MGESQLLLCLLIMNVSVDRPYHGREWQKGRAAWWRGRPCMNARFGPPREGDPKLLDFNGLGDCCRVL